MKVTFGIVAASFMLFTQSLAMPVEVASDSVEPASGNEPDAVATALQPDCKSRYLVDMCLNSPKDTGSFCDNAGNFSSRIKACEFPACYCA